MKASKGLQSLTIFSFMVFAGLSQAQNVQLVTRPDLSKSVAAFPHLAPNAPHASKINAAVDKIEQDLLAKTANCRSLVASSGFTRDIEVTMLGPRFISYKVSDNFLCPSQIHSDAQTTAFVYDLNTGRPVNWPRLFPKSFMSKPVKVKSTTDITLGLMQSPVLQRLYIEGQRVVGDGNDACTKAFKERTLNFMIWPDAKERALVLDQEDLPAQLKNCGDVVMVPLEQLRKIGVGKKLIDDLEAGIAAPTDDEKEALKE